ncbi:restriction endonuclease subunit M [Globicatella sanguinis]|uniref:restriction endonuclease subunit M n=1 Tax=Globicatella sanguinis TaxID=13076 RepID=UPI002542BCB9|nr:N-6 DNA methylase [Globicatella sanguinis]MDK7631463.1 N-6 DNA methylase [Globicatella sanguinis]WIK67063.1 N-6 DNA methylase [Globicatella sanguinis]WKT56468.1 N-6 DNA methylase [Globicatella sanguinis]
MLNRKVIKKYIEDQPIKVVEKIDLEKNNIKYQHITQHREITKISGDEELVRAFLLTRLVNDLGYKPDKIEIEKEYKAGRPYTITSRIDIIVRDKKDNAFLFIEVKSPSDYIKEKEQVIEDQLFNLSAQENEKSGVKYLVLYTLNDEIENEIEDECMLIDKTITKNFNEWEINRQYLNELPSRYGRAQKQPFVKNSKNDLRTNFTPEYLSALQKDLHNVLWGGGGTDDNEIFSSLVNLILAKIQDEDEKNDGERYDFQSFVYNNSSEEEFESAEDLFNRINKLYRSALKEKLNVTDDNEINKSYVIDTKKFSLSKLKFTVQQLENLSFVDGKNSLNGKDILGDFFEGIIRDGFKQTKGQFFTPLKIVKFMLWGTQIDKLAIQRIKEDKVIPYMIDPSAGSGTFLIEYMKFITYTMKYMNSGDGKYNKDLGTSRAVKDRILSDWFYPDYRENKWAKDYIYGSEINFNLGTATKVNMILHGDGSTNIFVKDGLLPYKEYVKEQEPNVMTTNLKSDIYKHEHKDLRVNESFDVILTNPPFSVDLDNDTKKSLNKSFLFGDKKNSENLFIERYYQLLRENGRMAIVLPESIFDTTENKYIRLFLFKYFNIRAIVSLPQSTFAPYTNTKTSILFAQKKVSEELKIWNQTWDRISLEYSKLRTRILNIIKVYDGKAQKKNLASIKDLSQSEEANLIKDFLIEYSEDFDGNLSLSELIKKYYDDLKELCIYDKDTIDEFGYVNTWWVFNRLSKELDYDIFMAEVEEVGYKRTKNNTLYRPNDLFRESNGEILIDDVEENQMKVLDYLRKIEWS